MVPAGIVQSTLDQLTGLLEAGDMIIDGGNSYYRDDIQRARQLQAQGLHYVDCGTSGGVFGLERGFCLMIGGEDEAVQRLDPIWLTIAPGEGSAAATPGRTRTGGTAAHGYLHCGPNGAGHFVKMVHNGIEYGMMAALAEGLSIIKHADAGRRQGEIDAETTPLRDPWAYQYDIDVAEVAEVWRRGSVVSSWLVDLTADALARSPELSEFSGRVSDSGEGRWTLEAAIDTGVPAGVISHRAVRAVRLTRRRRLRRPRSCPRCARSSVVTPRRRADHAARARPCWPTRRPSPPGPPRRWLEFARDAVAARGTFTFAVSGGHTPWAMFAELAREDVPWAQVRLFQVDERAAPDGDPDRNLTHLRDSLRGGPAQAAQVTAMPVTEPDLAAAAVQYQASLPDRFDLVHLGLGPDGHTASLVPGDPVLAVTDRLVAVTGAYQGHQRMTLTYPALARADQLLWLITGADKRDPLARLLAGDQSIPAGRVQAERSLILADQSAA